MGRGSGDCGGLSGNHIISGLYFGHVCVFCLVIVIFVLIFSVADMSDYPLHRSSHLSGPGIMLKDVRPSSQSVPLSYMHSDDYYMFCLVTGGHCTFSIDFGLYTCSVGDIAVVRPGQLHRLHEWTDVEAVVLMADSAYVGDAARRVFDRCMFGNVSLLGSCSSFSEMVNIFSILRHHLGQTDNVISRSIVCGLSSAVADMFASEFCNLGCLSSVPYRFVNMSVIFRRLLDDNICHYHSPSFYAAKMNVSVSYLNEAVKAVTGKSVSRNIREELILRAKRMLIYGNLGIGEISLQLGISDSAYFTRLFTRETGMSPSAFRCKYLE